MPILVRPVREQIEHDRVIRQLQDKWRRKYRADINPGDERTAVVQAGTVQFYPDVVLTTEGQKKPSAVVEVETGESVNHLEAMSQWATFAKSRIPFYLFVPAGSLDSARRLVADHQIELTELWTYFFIGEQIRFTPVIRTAASAGDLVLEAPMGKRSDKRVEKVERAAEKVAEKATAAPASDAQATVEPVEKTATAKGAAVAEREAVKPVVKAVKADKPGAAEKDKAAARAADKAAADRAASADKAAAAARAVAEKAAADKAAGEKAAGEKAAKDAPKADRKREEPRAPERAARPQRSERAAAPPAASKARRAGTAGRASAPPPRRKASVGTRAAAPKRGPSRPATKRAVTAKHPARRTAKPAAAAVRRPAKTSRPAAKRARAQKRK